ncbi:MAG: GntR family transcriptional regulator [Actinomycetales bacterium]|nr:GntR family transcriptional regulator [Actinomycetales bacterium]
MTAQPGDDSRPRRRTNLADDVAAHLRQVILAGRLRPGSRIDQDAIAEELGMSRLPVREALISLDREGLVHTIPRKGSYVARIDRDDIADHYQIFGQLAGLAAARAVARLDDAAIASLVDLHERMSVAAGVAEQQRLNHAFHRTINLAAGSPRMSSMLQLLSRSLPMPYADFPPAWLDEANRQHREIVEAVRRRDTLAAQRSMEQHINASARHAIEVLEGLGFFEDE